MVALLREAMGIQKVALLQPQLLGLAVHLGQKGLDVVLVALVGELEGLLDHVVYIAPFV